ncbi:DMT family transporter [Endozoicomonas montiporae]|uniref:DMT family permease n=1 Tax=Endozoicomonas montiporae CL-33 TaxID=570277 RepID=A0A142BH61_9GAMM|nr:DMT family transporter [Endozoicomonas montiporae]AMO58087.1 DMT family permease [Endozoicomonas montiporae CL-33]
MTQTNKADVVIFLITILAATGWIFTKMATGGMPALLFLGLRFTCAGLVVALFCIRQLSQLSGKQILMATQTGLVQAIGLAIWVTAISLSEQLSEGAFITSTLVIMVPFVGRLFFGTSIQREVLIALPLACIGLALLALDTSWQFEPAQVLFLISAVFFALHINLLSHFGKGVPALPMTSIQLLMVGVVGLLGFTLFETLTVSISADIWWWLAASVLIATSLRYFMQTWGFKYSNPTYAAVIMILEPVWTSLMSVAVLGESLTSRNILGCLVILAALLITRYQQLLALFSRQTGDKTEAYCQTEQNV